LGLILESAPRSRASITRKTFATKCRNKSPKIRGGCLRNHEHVPSIDWLNIPQRQHRPGLIEEAAKLGATHHRTKGGNGASAGLPPQEIVTHGGERIEAMAKLQAILLVGTRGGEPW